MRPLLYKGISPFQSSTITPSSTIVNFFVKMQPTEKSTSNQPQAAVAMSEYIFLPSCHIMIHHIDQRLWLRLKAVRQTPSKDNVNTKPLVFVVEEPERCVIILIRTFVPAFNAHLP